MFNQGSNDMSNSPEMQESRMNYGILFGAIGALAGLIFFLKGGLGEVTDTSKYDSIIVAGAPVKLDKTAGNSADGGLGSFVSRKIAGGTELNVPENGIESKLIQFIEDSSRVVDKTTWFSFDRLYFETGKSTLEARSKEQLDNIAAIMKAYPQVTIKTGGYTDNVGNPEANVKLSQSRADVTKAGLVERGIAANRIEAEGYGDQFPIADNETQDGRAKNRRIDVRVTKK